MTQRFRTVGIDIGGTNIKIATLWSDGELVRATRIPTQADAGPAAALPRLIAAVEQLLHESDMSVETLRTIGVDSEPDAGSEFWFTVTLDVDGAAAVAPVWPCPSLSHTLMGP